jgi:hypothetical protein
MIIGKPRSLLKKDCRFWQSKSIYIVHRLTLILSKNKKYIFVFLFLYGFLCSGFQAYQFEIHFL